MKITGRRFVWACAWIVTAAIGCGGNDGLSTRGTDGGAGAGTAGASAGTAGAGTAGAGAGTCGKVQPCGGAVVGTWKAGQICIVDSSFLMSDATEICDTATVTITSLSEMGDITFNADLSYQATGSDMFNLKITVPSACIAAGETCADIDANIKAQMQQDPTITSAACAPSDTACVCDETFVKDSSDSGTYALSGTDITSTSSDGTASTDGYCVQGNVLHDLAIDMTMPMGSTGMAKIQADFVLTKE